MTILTLLAGLVAPPAAVAAGDERVALRFVNADIDAVMRAIGHYTGRTFVVDPRVKGTISLVSEKSLTRDQALAALTTALRMQGYAIIDAGGVSRVVPETEAKFQGGVVGTQGVPGSARGDQVLTQVFRLQYESAANILAVVRPLVPATNPVTASPAGNAIVVTDYAENLRRIEKVIAALDIPPASNTEVIVLRNAIATDVAAMVSRLTDPGGTTADATQKVTVLADPATNSIVLLSTNPGRTHLAKVLVSSLDQPSARGTGVHVVPLRNAEAASLAKTLTGVRIADPLAGGRFGTGGGALVPGQSAVGTDSQAVTTVIADAASNSLVITAADPAYRALRAVIDKLDVRRAQVFIECLIVEVTSDQAAEFGIQWMGGLDNVGRNSTAVIGGTNFGTGGQNILNGARNLGSLSQGLNIGIVKGQITIPGLGTVTNLAALARALESNTKANILSTPNILTLDNEEAKIVVGQNVPFVTGQFLNQASAGGANVNPFQTIERKDVGLTLKVKPQISEGGTVRLAIYQEVSSVQDSSSATGIITNKRSLETNVIIDDGNIVVLGGLVKDQLDRTTQKVPGLGDIPWLGQLFRYETRHMQKTNLMLFLRPHVIRDESGSAVLTVDRYDAMRREQKSTTPLPPNLVLPKMEGAVMPPFDLRQKPPAPPAAPSAAPSAEMPAPAPAAQ